MCVCVNVCVNVCVCVWVCVCVYCVCVLCSQNMWVSIWMHLRFDICCCVCMDNSYILISASMWQFRHCRLYCCWHPPSFCNSSRHILYFFVLFYLHWFQAVLAVVHAVLQASHVSYKFASGCGYAKLICTWLFIAGRRAGG